MSSSVDIAVVGATGAVGEAVLAILSERQSPLGKVRAVAENAGARVEYRDGYLRCEALEEFDFGSCRLAIFCLPAAAAGEYAPRATAAGCIVVDTSSRFRGRDQVPLVIPPVNGGLLSPSPQIIAAPGPLAVQVACALKPLQDAAGIERIDVASYQAVSASGKAGIDELAGQTAMLLNGREAKGRVYPKQIAFNCLPQVGELLENGHTREEMDFIEGIRSVFETAGLPIGITAVRVPVFYGHGAAVHLWLREPLPAAEARALLAGAAGITVLDGVGEGQYPTAVTEAATQDDVFVGRIRNDLDDPRGLNFWVVADNVRRGAALNSVQIAELVIRDLP